MAYRMKAVERLIVGGLYTALFLTIIAPLLVVVGIVLGLIDITWQLAFGREGIEPMNLFRSAWMAQIQNVTWAFTGEGDFQLTIFG